MTGKSPYQLLGVREDASFEEIQAAKNRLMSSTTASEEELEKIEEAYDMILMQRLRLRQEGKIMVPDRIRYAERTIEPEAAPLSKTTSPTFTIPEWLNRWIDTPDTQDIVLPAAILGGLCAWAALVPATPTSELPLPAAQLAIGLLVCIYFLNRKENKFMRSVLLSFVSMVVGVVVAFGVTSVFPDVSGALLLGIAFSVMWVATVFLR